MPLRRPGRTGSPGLEPSCQINDTSYFILGVGTAGHSCYRKTRVENIVAVAASLYAVIHNQLGHNPPAILEPIADNFTDGLLPASLPLDPFSQFATAFTDMAGRAGDAVILDQLPCRIGQTG